MNREIEHWAHENQGKAELSLEDLDNLITRIRRHYNKVDESGNWNLDEAKHDSNNLKVTHTSLSIAKHSNYGAQIDFFGEPNPYKIGPVVLQNSTEIEQAIHIITPLIVDIDKINKAYAIRDKEFNDSFTLDVLPNEVFDGERLYLGQGIVIGQVDKGHQAYRVLHCAKHQNVSFERINEWNYSSIDEAIESTAGNNWLGTVAIIQGAKIDEKLLSIAAKRYATELFK